jgi:conjugal transfer/entry exclusion protein
MSLKPPVIPMTDIPEQTQVLLKQKEMLHMQIQQLQQHVQQIENSLQENENLKHKIQGLMADSMGAFKVEWERKSTYFPEIELSMLQKAMELIAPPPAKK